MGTRKRNKIYLYTDYRRFLHDRFALRRKTDTTYSHREMARELGFPSPNHLKRIMDGSLNLGARSLKRILEGLGLRTREKEYFSYLVFFNQADDPIRKNYYFGLMSSLRSPLDVQPLSEQEFAYYSEWYHCVVRELVVRMPPPIDFTELAARTLPVITPTQARRSVELLQRLGLIQAYDDGSFTLSERIIGTEREVTSLAIRNHHSSMLDLARRAMDNVPRERREISGVTMCVSDRCMQAIKQRVQAFEDEILAMVQSDTGAERVYQLNLQYFPLSQTPEERP